VAILAVELFHGAHLVFARLGLGGELGERLADLALAAADLHDSSTGRILSFIWRRLSALMRSPKRLRLHFAARVRFRAIVFAEWQLGQRLCRFVIAPIAALDGSLSGST
jgi:hypothetical protein